MKVWGRDARGARCATWTGSSGRTDALYGELPFFYLNTVVLLFVFGNYPPTMA